MSMLIVLLLSSVLLLVVLLSVRVCPLNKLVVRNVSPLLLLRPPVVLLLVRIGHNKILYRFLERLRYDYIYLLNFVNEYFDIIEQGYFLLRSDAAASAFRALDSASRKRKPCKWSRVICSEVRVSSDFEIFPVFTLSR